MALLERSQNILDVYQGHHLHSTRLKDELQERIDQASLKASEDITQHTNSSHGDAASTTAAFIQQDPSSLAKEVAQQEEFTKQVKFLWAESNNKRKFVHYLMDGHREHITSRQCMQAEEARLAAKAELKGWKQAAQERRDRIAATARQLDSELQHLNPQLEHVQHMTRDIRGKELELASLMHGRPAHERITAAEAEAKLEDQRATDYYQVTQLHTASSHLDASRAQLAARQAELAALKKELEALSQDRVQATRAAESARQNAKDVDGSLGKAYSWHQSVYSLLSSLVGVSHIDTSSTSDCIRITYNTSAPGATFPLAMYFGPDGLVKAELENSVERIDDLVAEAKRRGDLRLLVRGVRERYLVC